MAAMYKIVLPCYSVLEHMHIVLLHSGAYTYIARILEKGRDVQKLK